MTAPRPITADQAAQERSIRLAIAMDLTMLALFTVIGVLGGSLTILAESIRGGLGILIECFAFVVMRRVHRGVLADLEYGTGKLEQIANLGIGVGLLAGGLWVASGALGIVAGERAVGVPFGLAMAAIAGMFNLYVNLLAWDAMRRAARTGHSLIMQAQLTARVVKLFSSLFIAAAMTLAAVSTDEVVVAWADATGSLFVAGFMFVTAIDILRSGIPDLLDRTAGLEVQQAINRALARHFDDYARLDRVRSRQSGHVVFIEIALGFDADMKLAEVHRRTTAMKAEIEREIAHAEIAILAGAHSA